MASLHSGILSRLDMMKSVPRLNPAVRWEKLDSGELMAVYKLKRTGWKRILAQLLHAPEVGQAVLDATGAQVLQFIDGEHTVKELVTITEETLKLSRKEAEVSVLTYLDMLGRRGLLGLEITPHKGDTV